MVSFPKYLDKKMAKWDWNSFPDDHPCFVDGCTICSLLSSLLKHTGRCVLSRSKDGCGRCMQVDAILHYHVDKCMRNAGSDEYSQGKFPVFWKQVPFSVICKTLELKVVFHCIWEDDVQTFEDKWRKYVERKISEIPVFTLETILNRCSTRSI